MSRQSIRSQRGFTIVELMVATLVFSTILVIITAGVLYFTKSYYTSLTRSRTQDTARAVVDSISQAIQFTGTTIATTDDTGSSYFCAGGKVYDFVPGVQYKGGAATIANPGLYVAPAPSGCAALASADYNDPQATQLLDRNMRIGHLEVKKVGTQLFSISVTVAYGDDDLLTATTGSNMACKSQIGSQFCAVSTISTTVQQRLQDSQLR